MIDPIQVTIKGHRFTIEWGEIHGEDGLIVFGRTGLLDGEVHDTVGFAVDHLMCLTERWKQSSLKRYAVAHMDWEGYLTQHFVNAESPAEAAAEVMRSLNEPDLSLLKPDHDPDPVPLPDLPDTLPEIEQYAIDCDQCIVVEEVP